MKIYQLLIIIFLIGCENNNNITCILPEQIINSNSPVLINNQIELKIIEEDNNTEAKYSWTGPNGFTSNLKNPIIPNSTTANSGEYKLVKKIGLCESEVVSTMVTVVTNPITCNINENVLKYDNSSFNVFSILKSNNELYCNTNLGQLVITFNPNNNVINSGVYNTVNNFGNNPNIREVKMRFTNSPNIFSENNKEVVVTSNNNNLTIKFCNINFLSSNNSAELSAHLKE